MKASTPELLKFQKLQRRLGESRRGTIGLLEGLWLGVAKNCPQGDIGRFSNEEIAIICDWDGDPDELIQSLVDCRWLDACETNRLVVHDWEHHCPNYIKGGLARKKQNPVTNPIAGGGEPPKGDESNAACESGPEGSLATTPEVQPKVIAKVQPRLIADPDSACTPEVPPTKPSLTKPSQSFSLSSEADGEGEPKSPSPSDVMDAWNRSGATVKVKSLTADRAAKLRTRLKDASWPWREAIAMLPIPNSERFTWQPDFDWLINNSTNAVKIVEGKYRQPASTGQSNSPISKPLPLLRPKVAQ